jgi:hypothetical protein
MALKKWLFTEEEPKKENNDPVSRLVIEDNSAMTEGRKKTLEMVTDAIMQKAIDDILDGPKWAVNQEVRQAEEEIDACHREVMRGRAKIIDFSKAVEKMKKAGIIK